MLSQHSIFASHNQKQIVALTQSDIDELSRIAMQTRYETFADHFSLAQLEEFYDERYCEKVRQELADKNILYLVYKDNGKIFGYAKLFFLDDGVAKLDKLYFLKSHHRQGFGRQLINHCFKVASERGCDQMFLHAYHANPVPIAFYQSLGFQQKDGLVDYVEPSTGEVYPNSNIVMERNNLLACKPAFK